MLRPNSKVLFTLVTLSEIAFAFEDLPELDTDSMLNDKLWSVDTEKSLKTKIAINLTQNTILAILLVACFVQ